MPYTNQGGLPFSEPTTSRDAALAADAFAETQEMRVHQFIASKGAYGATMAEAEVEMPIKRSSACARFFALVAKGLIRKTQEKRAGCRVFEAVK
jgi:hypothetical protein